MSSYGNHVWTQEREDAARKLVDAAMDCDDDGFAEILHGIAGINIGWPFGPEAPRMYQPGPEGFRESLAVTALLANNYPPLGCLAVEHREYFMTAAVRLACSPVKSVSAAWALTRAAYRGSRARNGKRTSVSRGAGAGSQAPGADTARRCR